MVDFQQFPNQFVELLNLCHQSSHSGDMMMNFVCILELSMSGDALLKIVQ